VFGSATYSQKAQGALTRAMTKAKRGTIVITTINRPTAAVRKIASHCPDWHFIVVGDTKTPEDWAWPEVTYLSLDEQLSQFGSFAEKCPTRHYARKNIGYLKAIREKTPVLAETDDDNIPYDSYLWDIHRELQARPILRKGWENVYTHFTGARIWPRGFPLELINQSLQETAQLGEIATFDCPIQQFLADGDPDVDAIYRLTMSVSTKFEVNRVVLQPGTYCPFNSQNTVFWPDAYPLLYLPAYVSFRMTHIWRSFVAQRCLHAMGKPLAFLEATVIQERNEHSLIRDLQDEMPGYVNNHRIMEILDALVLSRDPGMCADNLGACYEALISAKIIRAEELDLVRLWTDSI
jgi:hypothetical protein